MYSVWGRLRRSPGQTDGDEVTRGHGGVTHGYGAFSRSRRSVTRRFGGRRVTRGDCSGGSKTTNRLFVNAIERGPPGGAPVASTDPIWGAAAMRSRWGTSISRRSESPLRGGRVVVFTYAAKRTPVTRWASGTKTKKSIP